MILSAILIFTINSPLLAGVGGSVGVWFFRALFLMSGLVFVVAFLLYVRVIWVERALRRNPWVVWQGRVRPALVQGHPATYVVELTHAEWKEPVVRTVAARAAASLVGEAPMGILAAGDPTGTLVISPTDGSRPMYARRPLVPGALGFWRRRAGL